MLHQEALRIVVRTDGILQCAGRDETSLRDVALSDDEHSCIGRHLVRMTVKVAVYGVYLHTLIDIARNGSIVIALLCQAEG